MSAEASDILVAEEYRGDAALLMPLLLMGDESEAMIGRYLPGGRIFAGRTGAGGYVAVCVVTEEADGWVEIKNLAVLPQWRRRGFGRAMLSYAEAFYPERNFRLGTGETPSTLCFYRSCGYRYSHRVEGFFTDNYPHAIVEEGVTLRDMLYRTKEKQSGGGE